MKNFDKEKVDRLIYGIGLDHSNRLCNFMNSSYDLTDKEFWYGFTEAYTSTDAYVNRGQMLDWVQYNMDRDYKHFMMTPYERRYFAKLPTSLTLYRGMYEFEYDSRVLGMSWTLSSSQAQKYVNHYNGYRATKEHPRLVGQIQIPKEMALCYKSCRKEKEVLVLFEEFPVTAFTLSVIEGSYSNGSRR